MKKRFYFIGIALILAVLILTAFSCTPQTQKVTPTGSLKELKCLTLDGKELTAAVFADYDLTVINVWGTYCSPCLSEMEALGDLERTLREKKSNVNFLSCCVDADVKGDTAKSIIINKGCDFEVIIPNSTVNSLLLNNVQYVPTTLFIDKNGDYVGEGEVGVPSGDTVEAYLKIINDRLALIQK